MAVKWIYKSADLLDSFGGSARIKYEYRHADALLDIIKSIRNARDSQNIYDAQAYAQQALEQAKNLYQELHSEGWIDELASRSQQNSRGRSRGV